MNIFINGLLTGLTLQLAIGPVFFFIINLALQRSFIDGFAGVLAVTLVDYLYISLAIVGIGKLIEHKKVKKPFGIISSGVLIILGSLILKGAVNGNTLNILTIASTGILTSFTSVFLITISSPQTIVTFTSLFTAKAVEYNYTRKELLIFGLGTGFATFLFMGLSVMIFSLIKGTVPALLIQLLNGIVGGLLIGYGILRFWKISQRENK
ncbi:LysE family transporter [Candidatus Daviesbacteria bacterium]|nr:LysE family transporter [Candidatus Daviesbacteria bacterium]